MVQPRKWVLGLLPLAVLALVAALWRQGSVEKDLTARVAEGLTRSGLSWAKALVAGRDSTLSGEAPSPEERAKAQSVADNVFGVRKVADAMTVLPEAKPFSITVLRDGAKITLVLFLVVIGLARMIFALTFPTLYRYIDQDFKENDRWDHLTPRERTWAGLLLLCVYLLVLAMLLANL